MTEDVLISTEGRVRRLSLNRPKAIHALNLPMCEAMIEALLAWRDDGAVEAVIIDHSEGRGFCAGGDIRMLATSGAKDGVEARLFFHTEYRLNHLLFTYPKPVVAFMDGITMGGGVGISQPAKYRVATEHTRFAMPETGIGLFPDVGGGWYLPRLEGRVGVYLALTGARLDGAECLALGLATHYLPSERLADAKPRLFEEPTAIAAILDQLAMDPPPARLAGNAERIARLFTSDRLEDILSGLAADPSEWAAKELNAVASKCPATSKVALRQFAESRVDFAEEMALEYGLACRMMLRPDFIEGVRAVLIDKDNAPRWNPATAEDVTEQMLDAIFAPLPDGEEWTPYPA